MPDESLDEISNHDQKRIEKVQDRVRAGLPDPSYTAPVDPYDIREFRSDALEGAPARKADIWNQVCEAHGFVWYTPTMLDSLVGLQAYIPTHLQGVLNEVGLNRENYEQFYQHRRHTVGQWRRTQPIGMAFTIEDLFSLFRTPESFDRWVVEKEERRRLAQLGLMLPRSFRP